MPSKIKAVAFTVQKEHGNVNGIHTEFPSRTMEEVEVLHSNNQSSNGEEVTQRGSQTELGRKRTNAVTWR